MRGFLFGILLIPFLVITVLSIRPGGLRRQLRHAARRLRLALVLAGIYLLASGVLRALYPSNSTAEVVQVALALVLAVVFVVLAQDPAEDAGSRP